jgi:hypothetical protein
LQPKVALGERLHCWFVVLDASACKRRLQDSLLWQLLMSLGTPAGHV